MSLQRTDPVLAPFQKFFEALLRKLLGKAAIEKEVDVPSSADGEAIFGLPMETLDRVDTTSVARVLSNARFLDVYATLVASRGDYPRAVVLLEHALAAGHPEPRRVQRVIDALRNAE